MMCKTQQVLRHAPASTVDAQKARHVKRFSACLSEFCAARLQNGGAAIACIPYRSRFNRYTNPLLEANFQHYSAFLYLTSNHSYACHITLSKNTRLISIMWKKRLKSYSDRINANKVPLLETSFDECFIGCMFIEKM